MHIRPKVRLELTPLDKSLEIMGWLLLCSVWVLTITHFTHLPDTLPIHYNTDGQPDRFGGKQTLFHLPVIASGLFLFMSFLNRFPHIFNYPVPITKENAYRQYTNATRTIRYLKLLIVVIYGTLTLRTIQTANKTAEGLGSWFVPTLLIFTLVPLVYALIKSFKMRK